MRGPPQSGPALPPKPPPPAAKMAADWAERATASSSASSTFMDTAACWRPPWRADIFASARSSLASMKAAMANSSCLRALATLLAAFVSWALSAVTSEAPDSTRSDRVAILAFILNTSMLLANTAASRFDFSSSAALRRQFARVRLFCADCTAFVRLASFAIDSAWSFAVSALTDGKPRGRRGFSACTAASCCWRCCCSWSC
mmetsp:Transcript_48381/g.71704  ORF Transcript_48381/g.71704 Transcript_48381/m.71704 type:complete len:202 (+) Transcript_48381:88-693(+)